MLQQVEIRTAFVIQSYNFAVHNGAARQIAG
jgi:hypothetical protein